MQPLLLFYASVVLAVGLPYDRADNLKFLIVSAIDRPMPESEIGLASHAITLQQLYADFVNSLGRR